MPLIRMPALSPTMTEGKLAKWLVSEGDQVSSGDVIAEIETDKAVMEVEALDDGVLSTISIAEGEEGVAVGTVIGEILDEGEESQIGKDEVAAPVVKEEQKGEIKEEVVIPKIINQHSSSIEVDEKRIFASPLAKRIAKDKSIDISSLSGSGPRGRIIKIDVENAISNPQNFSRPSSLAAGRNEQGSSYIQENSQMRKVIAQRLQQSKQEAPHFYLNMDIEIDAVLEARKSLNAHAPEGVKISVNDMIIKAAAIALKRVPEANASWEGDHTRYWNQADISVAVAIEGGLVTPIIVAAEDKGLNAISQEMQDLAKRAREGKLMPEEYTGGSFTISNLGMFGITSFSAVINPPQGAILAIGAGEERAVVKNGEIAVATVMTVTMSCDHRVIDGAVGASWLKLFKEIIENPVLALA